jgi:hypothetical protein
MLTGTIVLLPPVALILSILSNSILFLLCSSLPNRYFSYYILHSVPRRNNPSDVHDQDQYLLQIVFADGDTASMTFLENWMASYLSSAGKGVVMEDLSGEMDGT